MHDLFYICVGINFVDWTVGEKSFLYEKCFKICICLCQFDRPRWQDVKTQLLTFLNPTHFSHHYCSAVMPAWKKALSSKFKYTSVATIMASASLVSTCADLKEILLTLRTDLWLQIKHVFTTLHIKQSNSQCNRNSLTCPHQRRPRSLRWQGKWWHWLLLFFGGGGGGAVDDNDIFDDGFSSTVIQ